MSKEGQVRQGRKSSKGKKHIRWNTEKFAEFVKDNSDSTLLSEYKTQKEEVEIKCACNEIYFTTPSGFIHNNIRTCKKCSYKRVSDSLSHTFEEVKNFIEKESNSGCLLLSNNYTNDRDLNLEVKCKCNRDFVTNYATFKKGKHKCDFCTGKRRWTYESFKDYVENDSLSNCKLISVELGKSSENLLFLCSCKREFKTTRSNFVKGKHLCNKCSKERQTKNERHSYEYVKNFIESNSKCILLSKTYERSVDRLLLKCGCQREFEVSFSNFRGTEGTKKPKRQCNECSLKEKGREGRLKYEDIKHYIEVESNSGCKLMQDHYDHIEKPMNVMCSCGELYSVSFKDFDYRSRHRCLTCTGRISKGEMEVRKFLDARNIRYKTEHSCDELVGVGGGTLRFDFVVFDEDGKILTKIEVNGIQHDKPIEVFGGEEAFRKQQIHDQMKMDYCKERNIPLLVIPCDDRKGIKQIKYILEDYFKDLF